MALGTKSATAMSVVVFIAAVAAIAASITVVKQSNRIDTIERRMSSGSVDQVVAEADRDPRNKHFSLVSPQNSTVRVDGAVTTRQGDAVITGGTLDGNGSDADYQLWAKIPGAEVPVAYLGSDPSRPLVVRVPPAATALVVAEVSSDAATPGTVIVQGDLPPLP